MSAQYGCHFNHLLKTEGATWGVVRAFWLPNGASAGLQEWRTIIVSITYHTTGVRKGCTGAYCGLEIVPRK